MKTSLRRVVTGVWQGLFGSVRSATAQCIAPSNSKQSLQPIIEEFRLAAQSLGSITFIGNRSGGVIAGAEGADPVAEHFELLVALSTVGKELLQLVALAPQPLAVLVPPLQLDKATL